MGPGAFKPHAHGFALDRTAVRSVQRHDTIATGEGQVDMSLIAQKLLELHDSAGIPTLESAKLHTFRPQPDLEQLAVTMQGGLWNGGPQDCAVTEPDSFVCVIRTGPRNGEDVHAR